jgi:hypothetical protein
MRVQPVLGEGVAALVLGLDAVHLARQIGREHDLIPAPLHVANLNERSIAIWIPGQGSELEPRLRVGTRHGGR